MSTTELGTKEEKIRARVAGLAKLGAMRPGTLTVQYRNPGERKTPFHQISYTRKGRSHSEYVRPESLPAVRREVAAYKKFRRLVEKLIDLSLEASRLRHKRG
jgi:hypothetical protein